MRSDKPLDSIQGKNKLDTSDPVQVYFYKEGDLYEYTHFARTHTDYEITQLWSLFEHLETFIDVDFQRTTDRDSADLQFGVFDGRPENSRQTDDGTYYGAGLPYGHFDFPDKDGNGKEGMLNTIGYFGWSDKPGGQFDQGGTFYYLALHELGHGLGLGHPGDDGNSSKIMDRSYGLEQAIFTVMADANPSYGSWGGRVDGARNDSVISTFGALDIAALQNMYGANTSHAAGDDVYSLAATRAAARGYQTIWDTGGTDSMEYTGDANAVIDLRAATLKYEAGGGGFVSWVWNIPGGYTIAHGVVIENATSGNGDDRLTGNEADNVLSAGAGDDTLIGNAGDDTLTGGGGADTFRYSSSAFGADTITDFEDGLDIIDFKDSGLRYTDLTISNNGQDKVIDTGSGNTITLTGQASASIDAADFSFNAKTIQVSINDVTVTEGGAAQFTIQLDAVSGKDVSVNWTTSNGTATAGSDYTAQTSQPVTIAAGQQSATVSVQTTDDGDDENDETFTVTLSNPVNALLGDDTGEATITDNDDPPPDNKYATLIATLKGYAAETQHGQAHVDRWMKALAGLGEDNGYTPMTADEAQDMADTYSASRWNPVVAALTEIEAEQAASTPPVASIDDVTVTEGGQAQFTVSLDKTWSDDVTLTWDTSDGTATNGKDYTGQSNQTLTIAAGQQSATVSVQTTDDGDDEANETFTVALSNASNATLSDATGEATITDNDDPPSENKYAALIATLEGYAAETQHGQAHVDRWKEALAGLGVDNGYDPMTADEAQNMADTYTASRWNPVVEALKEIEAEREAEQTASTLPVASIDDVTMTEGGQAQFTVSLDKTWSDDVTLTWDTSDGTATDGSDYTGQSNQTLTIATGQQSATFNVQTTSDSLDEDDETFTVTLSSPTNATIGDDTGEATITDDDSAPKLSIGDVTVTEGGTAQFTIQLDAVSGKDVTFNWATSDGTATAGSDYTAQASQSVTISAGQQSATVSVQTTDDGDDEANETFTVELSGATNATISDATGEATITDNDDAPPPPLPPPPPPPPVLPVAAIDDVTVTEGGQAQFTVSLDKVWTSDVTLAWSTSDGTATGGSDYTGQSSQTLTIAAGQQSATLTVQTTDDSDDENDETFTVTLSNPANATLGDATGLATITDNDDAPTPDPDPEPDPDPIPDDWDHNGVTVTGTDSSDYLYGSSQNDLIDGRDGRDRIEAGAGDDRITGGAGADRFQILDKAGHDVITDYNPDEGDSILFSNVGFSSYSQMLEHTEQNGDDVVIHTSPDDKAHSLTLLDVQLSDLDEWQFTIVGGPQASLTAALATPQATARLSSPAPAFSLGDGAVGGHHAGLDEFGIEEMLASYYDNYFEIA